jgi:hypothetical protein
MVGGTRLSFDCRCGEAMANCLVRVDVIETPCLVHLLPFAGLNGLASRSHDAARGKPTRIVMVSDDDPRAKLPKAREQNFKVDDQHLQQINKSNQGATRSQPTMRR